ncbi:methylmalonyl Co-A mutase-associated GTPase MeaB [Echinicola soli]|uniref:Methylmalonyl Co-A mutase-associated GTPase MeaB n=1 Tax=Echinicola soli TaxID=2591634 RepID=A0A514CCK4_9BACT|nr:methylmalonyl Co-A mutase-associated GTPase MeaB [Echinicola soli]QDH77510.1 methylmalonyl Co-A mutase-associated GTPase MeaB [Echinicola soli]
MSRPRNKRMDPAAYAEGVLSGDRAMLSKAITLVESKLEEDQLVADRVLQLLLPHTGKAKRIGVTGAPGVGKSTFIEQFGQEILQEGHRLAVLSIDPSSKQSGGSILGDKTRMEILAKSPDAFIRPSPGSGHYGGVTFCTREVMLVCEAAGFDVVIVETIGVGQSEAQVKEMVDFFLLIVQPEAGDELQGVKRGIMEMVDAIVVNKAEKDNLHKAKQTKQQLENACHLLTNRSVIGEIEVLLVSSVEKKGLKEVWKAVEDYFGQITETGFLASNRLDQRKYWFYAHVQKSLEQRFYQDPVVMKKMEEALSEISDAKELPSAVARNLVNAFFKH